MTYRPAKAKPRRRRRQDDIDQARFDLRPHSEGRKAEEGGRKTGEEFPPSSDLVPPSSKSEPLPGQAGLPLKEKP